MDTLLQVKDLGFSYDGGHQIFKDINFEVLSGEIVCLLGPNGIGKTTLLNCLARLREPLHGNVLLNGADMADMPPRSVARVIGYVPQTLLPSFDYTVLEYVVTGNAPWLNTFEKPGPKHYQRAEAALEQMEISHLAQKPTPASAPVNCSRFRSRAPSPTGSPDPDG
jgi:iron complex transport system ATP-binding protein